MSHTRITGPIPSSRSKFICGEALGIDPDDKLLRVKLENGKTRVGRGCDRETPRRARERGGGR
eukprot:1367543-Amorphochlora_amoeboformis.AAC.1